MIRSNGCASSEEFSRTFHDILESFGESREKLTHESDASWQEQDRFRPWMVRSHPKSQHGSPLAAVAYSEVFRAALPLIHGSSARENVAEKPWNRIKSSQLHFQVLTSPERGPHRVSTRGEKSRTPRTVKPENHRITKAEKGTSPPTIQSRIS